MGLTELECRKAKAEEKSLYLSDGDGLILEVRTTGRKYWIARVWADGKEKRRSLGPYPDVSLKEAREKNRELRKGFNPSGNELFGDVAEEWFQKKVDGVHAPSYVRVIRLRMDRFLSSIGKRKISEISSALILQLCRTIEDAGTIETAHRVKQLAGQICKYAVATGRMDNDPTAALRGALVPSRETHYATITDPEGARSLFRAIRSYRGVMMRLALLFTIYTFARPGEVRHAEWCEIEGDAWRIPGEKMKAGRPHIVPLSRQLIDVIDQLRNLTGHQRWLFPSPRNDGRPMSENGIRVALRTMGYGNEDMTAHGFRSMASTILNENGFTPDVIERQLAHVERNQVRAAYNHAEYLPQRREMMQWWADWLDERKNGDHFGGVNEMV